MAIDPKLLAAARKVTAHRAKTVIDHIIEHGYISTEDLKDTYGYNHPPRAAGDVRDQGIPLETFKITGRDGRKIGAYRFGDPSMIEEGKLGGRKVLSKQLKKELVETYGARCALSSEEYDPSYLQVDHRVPYRVAGDTPNGEQNPNDFMLLSGSAQRQKSWACEHCQNFLVDRRVDICQTCYWAYPEGYTHVAMKQERRVELVFSGDEAKLYDRMEAEAKKANTSLQEKLKDYLPKLK